MIFSINLDSPLLARVTLTRKRFNKTLSSVRLTSLFPGFLLSRSSGDVSVDLSWPMSTRRCVQHGDLGHLLLLFTQWRQALLVNLILLSKTKSVLLIAILQEYWLLFPSLLPVWESHASKGLTPLTSV